MKETLRFAIAYWHTFCGTGGELAPVSGKQELYEALINQYI